MADEYDKRIMKILGRGPCLASEIAQQIGLNTDQTEERLYNLSQKSLAHQLPSGAYAFGSRNSRNHKPPQDEEHFA